MYLTYFSFMQRSHKPPFSFTVREGQAARHSVLLFSPRGEEAEETWRGGAGGGAGEGEEG